MKLIKDTDRSDREGFGISNGMVIVDEETFHAVLDNMIKQYVKSQKKNPTEIHMCHTIAELVGGIDVTGSEYKGLKITVWRIADGRIAIQ